MIRLSQPRPSVYLTGNEDPFEQVVASHSRCPFVPTTIHSLSRVGEVLPRRDPETSDVTENRPRETGRNDRHWVERDGLERDIGRRDTDGSY